MGQHIAVINFSACDCQVNFSLHLFVPNHTQLTQNFRLVQIILDKHVNFFYLEYIALEGDRPICLLTCFEMKTIHMCYSAQFQIMDFSWFGLAMVLSIVWPRIYCRDRFYCRFAGPDQ